MMNRRHFISAAALTGMGATSAMASCATKPSTSTTYHSIPKLKLSLDRIVKETVGLRPFRASGPRIGKEELGSKTIVHNYGHGGSGWSLSWGTGNMARELVLSTGERKIAFLGCVTIGLATTRLSQEKRAELKISTKD